MLLLTTAAAVLAMIAEFARRGNIPARAAVVVILALATFFMISAALVVFATFWSRMRRKSGGVRGESPFAEHRPPPQLVHPEEPV